MPTHNHIGRRHQRIVAEADADPARRVALHGDVGGRAVAVQGPPGLEGARWADVLRRLGNGLQQVGVVVGGQRLAREIDGGRRRVAGGQEVDLARSCCRVLRVGGARAHGSGVGIDQIHAAGGNDRVLAVASVEQAGERDAGGSTSL